MSKLIDLHIHSIYSDGKYNPKDIFKLAKENNVGLISITDHDDIRSAQEVRKRLYESDIFFVNGIELSTLTSIDDKSFRVHILGYGYDEENKELNKIINEKKQIREIANTEYLENMCNKYSFLNPKMINDIEKNKFIRFSRLILKYLEDNNYSKEQIETIINYMNNNKFIYPNYEFSDEEAISLLLSSKGIPVLAHPYQYRLNEEEERKLLDKLISMGLQGIEIYHSGDTPEGMKLQEKICDDYNLLWSAGSDYHTDIDDDDNKIGLGKNKNLMIEDCSLVKVLKKENKIYRR